MDITFDDKYHGHSINTNSDKGYGCYKKILDNIEKHLDNKIENHSKVLAVRFDIRYPDDGIKRDDNKQISKFVYNFKRYLQRQNIKGGHNVDLSIVYVEERDKSLNKHYHFLALVNGNAIKNKYKIHENANKIWKRLCKVEDNGLVDFCNKDSRGNKHKNGIVIDRN